MKKVQLITVGACIGNPGPGGWAAILRYNEHKKELSPEQLKIAEPAITRLVRSAYLLDAFGDLGNKQQITDAYARFAAAVQEIESAFPKQP